MKAFTPPFRVSFPSVFRPSSYEGGEPKYSVVMLFYPAQFTEAHKKLWAGMATMADAVSREKFKIALKDLPANFRKPVRDGMEKAHLDGYGQGCKFATASSKQKPGLVDKDLQKLIAEEDFYAGCWARASIGAFAYNNKGKGVAFGLFNIQKLADDDSFSGRQDATEDFGEAPPEVFETEHAAPEEFADLGL